jgi:GNAT superfamily N-acetyltransferase
MAVKLRAARLSDLSHLYSLVKDTIHTVFPLYYPEAVVEWYVEVNSADAIASDITAGRVCVLEDDGRLVGTGTIDGNRICRVYVAPAYQKQGLGGYLFDALENLAARASDEAVVDATLPSVLFFEHRGYRTVGHQSWHIVARNGLPEADAVWDQMRKPLAAQPNAADAQAAAAGVPSAQADGALSAGADGDTGGASGTATGTVAPLGVAAPTAPGVPSAQ